MKQEVKKNLYRALLLLQNEQEIERFLHDLCTPQEINALAERWRVCGLLNEGGQSYRQIHDTTGASLTTIARVARFLHNESYHGYRLILDRQKSVVEK